MTENIKYTETSIGLIPSDWKVEKLGSLGKVISGLTYSPDDVKEEGVLVLRSSNIQDRKLKFLDNVYVNVSIGNFNPVKKGDILICVRNGSKSLIGKNALITEQIDGVAFGAFMAIFRSEFSEYLFQIFGTDLFQKEIHKNLGATINSINGSDLKLFKIPVPPIPEQEKIAALLSTWDVAIDNCKNIIEKISYRNKGLEQQFLSGKIRVKGFEKTQWHLKSVEEVAVFKNGKAHENCIDEEGDYFVVNSKFISTQGKVAKSSNENLCPLFKNDITMVMSDIPNGKAFAKCFYIPEDDKYTLNQRICALTARKGTDSKFLFYQMNRNNYYLAFNNGVSQTNLKKEEVLECPLLMPDIEEQIQIVKLIDTATEELNQYQQKLEALQLQKRGLMQQLLTGKTRVKI
jgi:type I restriction enzyme, S subunit